MTGGKIKQEAFNPEPLNGTSFDSKFDGIRKMPKFL